VHELGVEEVLLAGLRLTDLEGERIHALLIEGFVVKT
jgi:hypothetical protein